MRMLYIGLILGFMAGALIISIFNPKPRPTYMEDVAVAAATCSSFAGVNSVSAKMHAGLRLYIVCNDGRRMEVSNHDKK